MQLGGGNFKPLIRKKQLGRDAPRTIRHYTRTSTTKPCFEAAPRRASSDREPPRKRTKRGGNKGKAAPKPRKAEVGIYFILRRGVIPTKPSPKKVGKPVKLSPKKTVLPSIARKKGGKRVKSSKSPGYTTQDQRIVALFKIEKTNTETPTEASTQVKCVHLVLSSWKRSFDCELSRTDLTVRALARLLSTQVQKRRLQIRQNIRRHLLKTRVRRIPPIALSHLGRGAGGNQQHDQSPSCPTSLETSAHNASRLTDDHAKKKAKKTGTSNRSSAPKKAPEGSSGTGTSKRQAMISKKTALRKRTASHTQSKKSRRVSSGSRSGEAKDMVFIMSSLL
ncbi:hypothetical protein GN958_ATG20935 [Phytophthora infestans]|uniref:Uncharacterized protein n=1 Tax=Phytophthora infestans TaxID=4787 RepID=A0A8S9TN00_PHYIN|nr:hypothetical protein GN958_ATG20935 [Phytophthora infestans]